MIPAPLKEWMNRRTRKDQGILALFETPEALVHAVEKLRAQRVTDIEAYSPFPIHGMEHAMGLRRSFIPYLTLIFALTGAGLLFLFQAYTSSVSWPLNVGGKPFISWPAFIPITFEGNVLIGGVLTVLTLFATLGLPNLAKSPLDLRLTDNLFGVFVHRQDPNYNEAGLVQILKDCHAQEIKNI